MRNSKAKNIPGRKQEMVERRNNREKHYVEHKPKLMPTGRLNTDGTPEFVHVPRVQHVNMNNFYKNMKRSS